MTDHRSGSSGVVSGDVHYFSKLRIESEQTQPIVAIYLSIFGCLLILHQKQSAANCENKSVEFKLSHEWMNDIFPFFFVLTSFTSAERQADGQKKTHIISRRVACCRHRHRRVLKFVFVRFLFCNKHIISHYITKQSHCKNT